MEFAYLLCIALTSAHSKGFVQSKNRTVYSLKLWIPPLPPPEKSPHPTPKPTHWCLSVQLWFQQISFWMTRSYCGVFLKEILQNLFSSPETLIDRRVEMNCVIDDSCEIKFKLKSTIMKMCSVSGQSAWKCEYFQNKWHIERTKPRLCLCVNWIVANGNNCPKCLKLVYINEMCLILIFPHKN